MIVDLQLNQGGAPWPLLRDAVLAAEDAGYSTVWNLDHFSGAVFGVDSMLECFSTLGAWAEATTRIGLGSLVANVNNREPGVLANAAATVQEISGGRFTLGIGSGAAPGGVFSAEHDALGIDLLPTMARRHERLVEVMDRVLAIWGADRAPEFAGFPRPIARPRVIVGVNSEGLASIAGRRFDGVNIRADHPDRARLLAVARGASPRPEAFDCSVWAWFDPRLADGEHPMRRALEAEGVNRLVLAVRGAPVIADITATARLLP